MPTKPLRRPLEVRYAATVRACQLVNDQRTLLSTHREKWASGCGSDLCCKARNKCFGRGKVPCSILLIGEAPGDSEDCLGVPFCGPAGQLLDRIVARSIPSEVRIAFTNLCLCRPPKTTETHAPPPEAIRACAPRLEEFIRIADPSLIIAVGSLARDWLRQDRKGGVRFHKDIPVVDVVHPAAILRGPTAMRGLDVQKCETRIRAAVEKYLT